MSESGFKVAETTNFQILLVVQVIRRWAARCLGRLISFNLFNIKIIAKTHMMDWRGMETSTANLVAAQI